MIDHARIRRESMRWYLILAIYNARPNEVCEEILLSTMQAIYPDSTKLEMRKKLDYLSSRELVCLRKEPSGRWWASLSRTGVDIAEYNIDCEAGISRPEKYWG